MDVLIARPILAVGAELIFLFGEECLTSAGAVRFLRDTTDLDANEFMPNRECTGSSECASGF